MQRRPQRGDPPGPVALAFRRATDTVQALNGPVGGGKTTTLFEKFCMVQPMKQPPSPIDGVRRRVITVVHQDYRKLWRGPIPTYWKIFPKNMADSTWTGGRNDPATHEMKFEHVRDGGPVHVTVNFIAIGDQDPEDVMRGYETSDWLLMEADLLAEDVFTYAMTRLARAPGREHGDLLNPAIGCDFNAPQFESWVYERMTGEWAASRRLYQQPPAAFEVQKGIFELNPDCENLHNLDQGYYPRQIEELKARDIDLVRRFICNRPGYSKIGLPCYGEEYDDEVHAAKQALDPDPRLPLYLGVDAGGSPAAQLGQVKPGGRLWLLGEIIGAPGTGPQRFGAQINEVLASPRFSMFERADMMAFPDPSAFYGGDQESQGVADLDWVTKLREKTGIDCRSPGSNAILPRLTAVKNLLILPGRYPGLLLCPRHCPVTRRGFAQGYQFSKVERANNSGIYVPPVPVKNEYSHPHDAVQYLAMGALRYPLQVDTNAVRRQVKASTSGNPDGTWSGEARPAKAVTGGGGWD